MTVMTPLATVQQMTEGPYADLVAGYSTQALIDLMLEATSICESETDRRLVPFTTTESGRAEGMDPDEYSGSANLPLDLTGALGRSYAYAIGSNNLVRHLYLDQYAPRYQELWQYSNVSVGVKRSYGGGQILNPGQYLQPEPDSGHIFIALGVFVPTGSWWEVTYSGGYQTIPRDLQRACKYMAASIAVSELDPIAKSTEHDKEGLRAQADEILINYARQ